MGNDWQHWAEWTRRGLAYESNIASRHTQESHRRDLCCVLAPSAGAAIFSNRPSLNTTLVKRARCIAHTYSVPRHRPRHLTKKVVASLDQPKLFLHGSINLCIIFSQIDTLCNCIGRQSWTSVLLEIREEQKSAALNTMSHWSIWPCSRINESGVEREASRKRSVQVQNAYRATLPHPHIHEVVPTMIRRIVFAQTVLHQPRTLHERVRTKVIIGATTEVSSHTAKSRCLLA